MKIYFGRKTPLTSLLDIVFIENYLIKNDYNFNKSADLFLSDYENTNFEFYTINPLILNFFPDECLKYLYYYINGETIELDNDSHLLEKLQVMGLGEALCDDSRSFNS